MTHVVWLAVALLTRFEVGRDRKTADERLKKENPQNVQRLVMCGRNPVGEETSRRSES